jgi:hypothetical protein
MKLFAILISILLILNFLDLLTTYIVVCSRNGIEMNKLFILLSYKFGFIPAGIIKTLISILIVLPFYFVYKIVKFNVIKITCILGILLILIPFFIIVIFNLGVVFKICPIPFRVVEKFAGEIYYPNVEFNSNEFCKLIRFK